MGRDDLEERAKAVDERLNSAATLSALYKSLTTKQRKELAVHIENPSVDAISYKGGKRKSLVSERTVPILRRLQDGEEVASPVHERIRSWREQL